MLILTTKYLKYVFSELVKNNFIYLFLAVLGLHCCEGFSLVAASRGNSLTVSPRLPLEAASLAGHRLSGAQASVVAAHGLSIKVPGL